jgi:hypothetical protein
VGAGVIYAVIIALWALVLVPMWVRRHDEANESRSVDRFHDAMRILSRRGTDMPDQRQVLQPRRQPVVDVVVTGGHRPSATRSRAEARASQAQRRRRTLAVLAGVLLMVAGLSLLGAVPVWLNVLPLLLAAGFVVHLRQEARRASAREARLRRLRRESAGRAAVSGAVAGAVAGSQARRSERAREVFASSSAADVASSQPAEFYDAVADRVWEPVPVPVPTYVNAPKAPRSVRQVDLTQPGTYSSGRRVEDELFDQTRVDEDFETALAAEVDHTAAADERGYDQRRRAAGQ